MQNNQYDILICGAGLIGTSLALALASLPLRIAITDAQPIKTDIPLQTDGRSLALNYASVKILEAIGVWAELASFATPIKTVHVSERGHFGKARFNAEEEGVTALGYVMPAPVLGVTLNKALVQSSALTVFNPATVIALTKNEKGYAVTLQNSSNEAQIQAKLVIAADGVNSTLRELMGITAETHDYQQSALATRVELSAPHQNIAYERFIKAGALALLPLVDNKAALIWTGPNDLIQNLHQLDEQAFLQTVQENFSYRVGKIVQIEKRHVYPLKGMYAKEQVREAFVLLGNSAHTIHPIAAQGFNLGLQDVALLAELIADAVRTKQNYVELTYLQHYEQQRMKSQQAIIKFTNSIVSIFAHDFLPLTIARSSAIKLLDIIPPLKHRMAKRLMGTAGKLPKLILGIPLNK